MNRQGTDRPKRQHAGGLTRRQALAGATLAGAGAVLAKAPAPARAAAPSAGEADVIIVGAGLCGLTAATALVAAGKTVLVLEARDRVGGRNLDLPLGGGAVLEMGGQWTGPGQSEVRKLARSLGIETFATYSEGESLFYKGGALTRYTGSTPPIETPALLELLSVIGEVDSLAEGVQAGRPWLAARSAEFARQTIESWLAARVNKPETALLLEQAVRGVYGDEPAQISLLDLLSQITGVGGSIETLTGSAQSLRFVGGPQQMSVALAAALGSRVILSSPVYEIAPGQEAVQVTTGSGTYAAAEVLVAVPKAVAARIRFTPELPPAYGQYLTRQPSGSTVKVQAVYAKPFWREQGLSGVVVSDSGPIDLVYDNSPPDGSPGVLVGFAEGDFGRSLFKLSEKARRHAVLASLETYFGAGAGNVMRYEDLVWAAQPYTLGAYGSFNPPGVITSLGAAVTGPAGKIRFAGADYSPDWPGYMEGAIRSGKAAAAAIARA